MDAVVDVPVITSDFFELFGIPRKFDVDIDELNRRYITLQMKYHPDITGNDVDSASINYAYNVLLDPIKRAEHMLNFVEAGREKSCPIELFDIMEELAEADEKHKSEIIDNLTQMLDVVMQKISDLFEGNAAADVIISEINKAKYIKRMLGK